MTRTAAAEEQETPTPYPVPPRTPLTPEQAERAFAYDQALEAGSGAAVAGREQADLELAFLILRLTGDLVLPVTTVPDDEDPTADSFVPEQAGDLPLNRSGSGRSGARSPRSGFERRGSGCEVGC